MISLALRNYIFRNRKGESTLTYVQIELSVVLLSRMAVMAVGSQMSLIFHLFKLISNPQTLFGRNSLSVGVPGIPVQKAC